MARPTKNTVEYFSHDTDATGKRTLSILMNHFNHEGVSAWWQLLEHLGDSDNHFIDIRNPEDFEDLAAKMGFQPERLDQILKKMADMEAIDKKLYGYGIIWCQHFVDRLAAVYKTRGRDLPTKPNLFNSVPELKVSETELIVSETQLPIPEIPHSKVKYSKVENSIEKKMPTASNNSSESLKNVVKAFEEYGGALITPMVAQQLADAEREYGQEIVIAAFKKAAEGNGKRGPGLLNYCRPIFEEYKSEGISNASKLHRGKQDYKLPPPGLMEEK
jgi:DNA replication protein DnaD